MGGGTLISSENISFARKLGLIVMLYTPPEELAKRIFLHKETRPLFSDCQSLAEVENKVKEIWEVRKSSYEQADIIIDTTYNTMDSLKMHLALIEKRASNREYMHDVYNIMNKKIRPQSKWSEKEEEFLPENSDTI